jgi:Uma2 family endonuclease
MATVEEKKFPPLVEGQRLTRDEFMRRWECHPEIKRAELIGGMVYMPSPVGVDHGEMDIDVGFWLAYYAIFTPGTRGAVNTTILMSKDAPQPDSSLRILTEYGGQSSIQGKYLKGAAELNAEVCASSASYDLHQKFDLYQRAGVQEYLAVLLEESEVRWFRLGPNGFDRLLPGSDGIFRSIVFPGLWLDPKALFAGDRVRLLNVLQEGLNSPEHQAFVAKLAAAKKD